MRADSGPFNNLRFDHLDVAPSSGAFLLPNLLSSDFVSPSRLYRVFGNMSFRLGNAYEDFRTPMLGSGLNPRVFVDGGTVTNLGGLFRKAMEGGDEQS